jgi:hypothetical protein
MGLSWARHYYSSVTMHAFIKNQPLGFQVKLAPFMCTGDSPPHRLVLKHNVIPQVLRDAIVSATASADAFVANTEPPCDDDLLGQRIDRGLFQVCVLNRVKAAAAITAAGKEEEQPAAGKEEEQPVAGKEEEQPVAGKEEEQPVAGKNVEFLKHAFGRIFAIFRTPKPGYFQISATADARNTGPSSQLLPPPPPQRQSLTFQRYGAACGMIGGSGPKMSVVGNIGMPVDPYLYDKFCATMFRETVRGFYELPFLVVNCYTPLALCAITDSGPRFVTSTFELFTDASLLARFFLIQFEDGIAFKPDCVDPIQCERQLLFRTATVKYMVQIETAERAFFEDTWWPCLATLVGNGGSARFLNDKDLMRRFLVCLCKLSVAYAAFRWSSVLDAYGLLHQLGCHDQLQLSTEHFPAPSDYSPPELAAASTLQSALSQWRADNACSDQAEAAAAGELVNDADVAPFVAIDDSTDLSVLFPELWPVCTTGPPSETPPPPPPPLLKDDTVAFLQHAFASNPSNHLYPPTGMTVSDLYVHFHQCAVLIHRSTAAAATTASAATDTDTDTAAIQRDIDCELIIEDHAIAITDKPISRL